MVLRVCRHLQKLLGRLESYDDGGDTTEYGGVAQLGERLPCKQEVIGSNPFISTMGS